MKFQELEQAASKNALRNCPQPHRPRTASDYFLVLRDAETGQTLSRCAEGYGLASALVQNGRMHIFASRWDEGSWRDVTLFTSRDLSKWESKRVIEGDDEEIFNSSVCAGPDEFVMAYESNDVAYPPFTIKFAHSNNLKDWTKKGPMRLLQRGEVNLVVHLSCCSKS